MMVKGFKTVEISVTGKMGITVLTISFLPVFSKSIKATI